MPKKKVIYVLLCGSRGYSSYWQFAKVCDRLLKRYIDEGYRIYVIEGGARGADYLAFIYARRRGFKVITHRANWEEYGNAAGYRRNVTMSEVANVCIAFWDGRSPGTKHTISICTAKGLPTRTINVPVENPNGKKRRGSGAWREKARRALSEDRKRRSLQAHDPVAVG